MPLYENLESVDLAILINVWRIGKPNIFTNLKTKTFVVNNNKSNNDTDSSSNVENDNDDHNDDIDDDENHNDNDR